MSTVMVQMADQHWTSQALHLACALARNDHADVVLVRLMPVQHITWLGTEFGNTPVTSQEYQALRAYEVIAQDYGVHFSVQSMQYISLLDALVEAAEHVNAAAVFATVPESSIPYWRKFQLWTFERRLAARRCKLFTLDEPTNLANWTPSVTVRPSKQKSGPSLKPDSSELISRS